MEYNFSKCIPRNIVHWLFTIIWYRAPLNYKCGITTNNWGYLVNNREYRSEISDFQPHLGARLSISLLVAVASSVNWASHISSTFKWLYFTIFVNKLWKSTLVSTILFLAGSRTPKTCKNNWTRFHPQSPLTSATVNSLAFFPKFTKAHFPWITNASFFREKAGQTLAWETCSAQGSSSGSHPSSSFLRGTHLLHRILQ